MARRGGRGGSIPGSRAQGSRNLGLCRGFRRSVGCGCRKVRWYAVAFSSGVGWLVVWSDFFEAFVALVVDGWIDVQEEFALDVDWV